MSRDRREDRTQEVSGYLETSLAGMAWRHTDAPRSASSALCFVRTLARALS